MGIALQSPPDAHNASSTQLAIMQTQLGGALCSTSYLCVAASSCKLHTDNFDKAQKQEADANSILFVPPRVVRTDEAC